MKLIFTLDYTINDVGTTGISPCYKKAGRALHVEECVSVAEGIEKVRSLLRRENFTIVREDGKDED